MMTRGFLFTILFALIFGIFCLNFVHAEPPPGVDINSPTGQFYQDLKQPENGISCCSIADCSWTVLEEKDLPDGSEKAFVEEWNEWVDIPEHVIIKDKPNTLGQPILCGRKWDATENQESSYFIYCFLRGGRT